MESHEDTEINHNVESAENVKAFFETVTDETQTGFLYTLTLRCLFSCECDNGYLEQPEVTLLLFFQKRSLIYPAVGNQKTDVYDGSIGVAIGGNIHSFVLYCV